ncbi:hypothetical protein OG625_10115 [Streptomyces sp. NBC_01351]|uniref:hypothetical protein n=1 Tax=Streptomyces sp. NBC_01351 TaxID=2903833 RepID=UPI002E3256C6|nr:hypothetical protein [Streptomyces sp. NBC_01351]
MSGTTGKPVRRAPITLFDHALRLHRASPDRPFAREGQPYPDESVHRGRDSPEAPADRSLIGEDVARVLDAHFARAAAEPRELAFSFHKLCLPSHRNEHIAAAARRADLDRVLRTGRWLVRNGIDSCAVTVGLALLAEVGTTDDIPFIQMIGLLSAPFGPLAVEALERLPGAAESLLWYAERVTGWGRVDVVHALSSRDEPQVRAWLLRRSCDGDFLNSYFAGQVAVHVGLHEELGGLDTDAELVDHIGRILYLMHSCDGRGLTLADYPHAAAVLEAHARHVGPLGPTAQRFVTCTLLALQLTTKSPQAAGCTEEQHGALRETYTALLDRDAWIRTAREALAEEDETMLWLARYHGAELGLRAFRSS